MKLLRRILVTNDDGVNAPGLQVAETIANELAQEVWVVAPEHDQSGVGQGISMHTPLRARSIGAQRYAVSGTPADCVMYALGEWLADEPPELVLSGVNHGANIGDAVMYSGTVGAVLAAAHLRIPAVALSQAYRQDEAIDYAPAQALAGALVRKLWRPTHTDCCWNINFPALPVTAITDTRITHQASDSIRWPRLKVGVDGRGLGYRWLAFDYATEHAEGSHCDLAALRAGHVSLMPLQTSRCDEGRARSLAGTTDHALDAQLAIKESQ